MLSESPTQNSSAGEAREGIVGEPLLVKYSTARVASVTTAEICGRIHEGAREIERKLDLARKRSVVCREKIRVNTKIGTRDRK